MIHGKVRFCGIFFVVFGFFACRIGMAAHPKPETFLPHVTRGPQLKVKAGTPVHVFFKMDEGWQINSKAPSWIAIFKDGKNIFEVSASQMLEGDMFLPKLVAAASYRVQGTFYYCKHGSPTCQIRSWDQIVQAAVHEKRIGIEIPLPAK